MATNAVIMFLPLYGSLFLCPHKLRYMIPSLPANTKLSKAEQNMHLAMHLRCRALPHIANNPPLPQARKEVPHPCALEAMDIVIFLLGFTLSILSTNKRYNGVQAALIVPSLYVAPGQEGIRCMW